MSVLVRQLLGQVRSVRLQRRAGQLRAKFRAVSQFVSGAQPIQVLRRPWPQHAEHSRYSVSDTHRDRHAACMSVAFWRSVLKHFTINPKLINPKPKNSKNDLKQGVPIRSSRGGPSSALRGYAGSAGRGSSSGRCARPGTSCPGLGFSSSYG